RRPQGGAQPAQPAGPAPAVGPPRPGDHQSSPAGTARAAVLGRTPRRVHRTVRRPGPALTISTRPWADADPPTAAPSPAARPPAAPSPRRPGGLPPAPPTAIPPG